MEAVSVQFALLAVARGPGASSSASADLEAAAERAIGAGHRIVAEQTVADSEPTLRAQIQAFISDPQIDVVIVLAGAESDAASRAVKPLVTEVLPGFTDLFRWLMFQEAGASAMLSAAEAAQCGSTVVFVLPGAIAPAMDKLILPQFDPKTTPRNLVGKIARLRTETESAVPQEIGPEKTQGGSGMPARLPAPSGRMRSRTGAHVIHREQPTDDPTRPIDLVELEGELAASAGRPLTGPGNDDPTTMNIPAAPSLRDQTEADTYAPDPEEDHTDVTMAAPPPPKLVQHPGTIPSLVKPTAAAAKPATAPPPMKIPNIPSPSAVRRESATPMTPMPAVTIMPRNRPPSGDPPSKPPSVAPPKKQVFDEKTVIAAPSVEKLAEATKPAPAKAAPAKPAFEEARTTVAAPKGDTKPGVAKPTATAKNVPSVNEAKTVRAPAPPPQFDEAKTVRVPAPPPQFDEAKTVRAAKVEPEPPKPATNGKPVAPPAASDLDEAKTVDGASAVVSLSSVDAIEHIDPADLDEATPTPAPAPAPVKRPIAAPPPPAAATRPPTKPPATAPPPPATTTTSTRAARSTDFTYPVQKKGSVVLKLLMAALVIGIGFGGVVLFFHFRDQQDTPKAPDPTPQPVAVAPTVTPDAAVAVAPPPAIDAAEPDFEMEQPPPVTPTKPTPATVVAKPRTKPPTTTVVAAAGSNTPVTAPPPDAAPAPAAVADDDCDETSCILSKYDRPCCAKYKPATSDTDFKPRVGDTPESLDKVMVRAGIDHIKPRVVSCGEKSGIKGTVKIAMTVSADGVVTSASVADTPDPSLGDCVLAAMRSAKFGKTVNGGTFTYPFAF